MVWYVGRMQCSSPPAAPAYFKLILGWPCCCTSWWALLWTNRAKGGHVNKVHLQARCMKSMQAVRAKSVSPTSRGLRLPLSPSHGVKLLTSHKMMRKIEKKVVKEATRKKWVEKFPWIEWTGCMVLNQLHKKVSQIEIGRLEDGIDDGEPEI